MSANSACWDHKATYIQRNLGWSEISSRFHHQPSARTDPNDAAGRDLRPRDSDRRGTSQASVPLRKNSLVVPSNSFTLAVLVYALVSSNDVDGGLRVHRTGRGLPY
jgi:hypothetical protein